MTAISRNFLRLLGFTVLFCCASAAQSGESFPRQAPDQNLIKTQQKVDELFEKGDYERAMFIYREELAPGGDKFAQYMVGYMHYSGRGVAEDQVEASAWYRLAAERGEESYIRVRDVLLSLFNEEQRARSDAIYAELRGEMAQVGQFPNRTYQLALAELIPGTGPKFTPNHVFTGPVVSFDDHSVDGGNLSLIYTHFEVDGIILHANLHRGQ